MRKSSLLLPFLLSALPACHAPLRAPTSATAILPPKSVRLYETGVGYFERAGSVGSRDTALPEPAGHLDDALKSLVGQSQDKGTRVDRYESGLHKTEAQAPTPPALQGLLDKMSGLSYEVAQVGPYLVYTIGAPIESVTDGLFAGKGPYPMAAMKSFPGGGTLYLELDMGGVMRWLKALAPAARLPIVPARASTVSAWSYDGGAGSYQPFVIPPALLKAASYGIRLVASGACGQTGRSGGLLRQDLADGDLGEAVAVGQALHLGRDLDAPDHVEVAGDGADEGVDQVAPGVRGLRGGEVVHRLLLHVGQGEALIDEALLDQLQAVVGVGGVLRRHMAALGMGGGAEGDGGGEEEQGGGDIAKGLHRSASSKEGH